MNKNTVLTFMLSLTAANFSQAGQNLDAIPAVDLNSKTVDSKNQQRWPAIMSAGMRATSLEASVKYYTEMLGMIVRGRVIIGDFTEIILGFEGKPEQPGIIVFQTKGATEKLAVDHGNSERKIIIGVNDVQQIADKIKASGYRSEAIKQNGAFKILMAYDPDGYKLEIVERAQ